MINNNSIFIWIQQLFMLGCFESNIWMDVLEYQSWTFLKIL